MIPLTPEQVIDRETAKTKHFELAQGARVTSPEAELCTVTKRIKKLIEEQASIDEAKFVRLSSASFPELNDEQINFLIELCLAAHRSEDFYLNAATNQWVRTSIARIADDERLPHQLFGSTIPMSSITFQSNVLPCDPFLTKLDKGSKTFHFPCSLLKEAMDRKKPFVHILEKWKEKCEDFELKRMIHGPVRGSERQCPRLFWEIHDADWKLIKVLVEGDVSDGEVDVCVVTWKGGRFVRKKLLTVTELNITDKLSHPNIIYSFGVSHKLESNVSFLFMEYMEKDLFALIEDMVRINDDNRPPFPHEQSLDILLQAAKAMAHMHEENVVHGDLKPQNIFVSKFVMVGDVMQHLVKIADFGSARTIIEGKDFVAGGHTTEYGAPEVLKRQKGIELVLTNPKAIDVYSFGIIAFQVLTGEKLYMDYKGSMGYKVSALKKAIVGENLRPPLRKECRKHNSLQNKDLLALIVRCWDREPSERPSFLEVINVLNTSRRLLERSSSRTSLDRQVYFSFPSNIAQDALNLFRRSYMPIALVVVLVALLLPTLAYKEAATRRSSS